MKEYIRKLSEKHDLTREEATKAMETIMDGNATDSQIGAFLIALKSKGERPHELQAFVEVMRARCVKIHVDDPDAVDMCGTGGDDSGTFNISTAASFVVAGAGASVAKHGNRSVSSTCGSADVLRSLGVNVEIAPQKVEQCVNEAGIGFLFAPLFHPAMKYAAKPRAELGVKTCFNLLGPMTNPAGVRRQLVGAFSPDAARTMAAVFSALPSTKVFVVHSDDGLDEISLEGKTSVYDIESGTLRRSFDVHPKELGLAPAESARVRGGDPATNASMVLRVLKGEKGPMRDIVLANSAFGLHAAGKAATLLDGIAIARESIDSGKALRKLNQLKEFTSA